MNLKQTVFTPAGKKAALRRGLALFLMLLLFLVPAGTWAQQNFRDLSTAELKKKIDAREKVLIVDTRTSEEYRQGHLPTAVNIPPPQFGAIGERLPKEKDFPLVFYCRGYS